MPYRVNGTNITVQPTTGRWIKRDNIGMDGSGHPVYASLREFEMKWDIVDLATVHQIHDFFLSVSQTGTTVVSLPKYGSSTWIFYDYSGCTLHEPEYDVYFSENITSVILIVSSIHTVGTE